MQRDLFVFMANLFPMENKMSNIISLDLDLLKTLLDQEARKTVGKVMKRFEISDDKEIIKKATKEILYESYRDFYEMLKIGKIIFESGTKVNFNNPSKED